jgi:hypothetical protein
MSDYDKGCNGELPVESLTPEKIAVIQRERDGAVDDLIKAERRVAELGREATEAHKYLDAEKVPRVVTQYDGSLLTLSLLGRLEWASSNHADQLKSPPTDKVYSVPALPINADDEAIVDAAVDAAMAKQSLPTKGRMSELTPAAMLAGLVDSAYRDGYGDGPGDGDITVNTESHIAVLRDYIESQAAKIAELEQKLADAENVRAVDAQTIEDLMRSPPPTDDAQVAECGCPYVTRNGVRVVHHCYCKSIAFSTAER